MNFKQTLLLCAILTAPLSTIAEGEGIAEPPVEQSGLRAPSGSGSTGLHYSSNITGTPWEVRLLHGTPVEAGKSIPHITFSKSGEVTVFGGCNVLWGNYRSQFANKLIVTHLRGTRKACTQESYLEKNIASVLILANAYQLQQNRLSLLQSEFPERILMVLEAAPGLDTSAADVGRNDLATAKKAAAQKKKLSKKADKRRHKGKKSASPGKKEKKAHSPRKGRR